MCKYLPPVVVFLSCHTFLAILFLGKTCNSETVSVVNNSPTVKSSNNSISLNNADITGNKITVNQTPPSAAVTTKYSNQTKANKEETLGFAAEWEYSIHPEITPFSPSQNVSTPFPSRRVAPGTWHDSAGNWWLFSGQQQPSSSTPVHYLSDLWKYSQNTQTWSLVYRPETSYTSSSSKRSNITSNPFTSAFPQNLSNALLCGSRNNKRRFAVHGLIGSSSGTNRKTTSEIASNSVSSGASSLFSEDNVVWLFDKNPDISTWTSYICCDTCLPDGNNTTNFEFCPQFTRDTISWCDHSGIMMLQPASFTTANFATASEYSTAPTLFKGVNNTSSSSTTSSSSATQSIPGAAVNWWKFDVDSTEWIKLPPVTIPGYGETLLESGSCREVATSPSISPLEAADSGASDDQLIYLLCPGKTLPILDRSVILFDAARGSASILGTIHLNNAFADKKVWQQGRSTLHAISVPNLNISMIFLAYHKLLDLWIHDHSNDNLYPVENVWKANTLRKFQNHDTFYQLEVFIEGTTQQHTFFMVNPRNKLASFEASPVKFRVTIVPDKEVFLPRRDAESIKPVVAGATAEKSIRGKMETHRKNKYRAEIKLQKFAQQQQQKHKRVFGIKRPNFGTTLAPTSPTIRTSDGVTTETSEKQVVNKTVKPLEKGAVILPSVLKSEARKNVIRRKVQAVQAFSGESRVKVGESLEKARESTESPLKSSSSSSWTQSTSLSEISSNKSKGSNQTEMVPTPQKLEQAPTSQSEIAASTIVPITTTEIFTTISNQNEPGSTTTPEPALQGEVDPDHHIRSPGSMLYNGADSEDNSADMVQMWRENTETFSSSNLDANPNSSTAISVDPTIFFALTLTFFGSIGVVVFVRRCVKCPPTPLPHAEETDDTGSVLGSKMGSGHHSIRYAVMPDDLHFHTPIV